MTLDTRFGLVQIERDQLRDQRDAALEQRDAAIRERDELAEQLERAIDREAQIVARFGS